MKRESDEGIFEKYVRLLSEPESGKEEVREERGKKEENSSGKECG